MLLISPYLRICRLFPFLVTLKLITLTSAYCINDEEILRKQLASIPRIDCRHALTLFESGKAVLIFTHHEGSQTPILGAINIPLTKIDKVKLNIPKDRLILTYCT